MTGVSIMVQSAEERLTRQVTTVGQQVVFLSQQVMRLSTVMEQQSKLLAAQSEQLERQERLLQDMQRMQSVPQPVEEAPVVEEPEPGVPTDHATASGDRELTDLIDSLANGFPRQSTMIDTAVERTEVMVGSMEESENDAEESANVLHRLPSLSIDESVVSGENEPPIADTSDSDEQVQSLEGSDRFDL